MRCFIMAPLMLFSIHTVSISYAQCRSNFYGPGLNGNGWANLWVKSVPNDQLVDYRFRATHSNGLDRVVVCFGITLNPPYAKGTGGCIRVELREDDGSRSHLPSGFVIAAVDIDDPVTRGLYFPVIHFSPDPGILAGRLYHLVFRNITGQFSETCSCTGVECDPAENFVSVEQLYTPDGCDPQQPTISELDLATLESFDGGITWSKNCLHTPVFSLWYSDGAGGGVGYIGARSGAPRNIGGSSMVRENFLIGSQSIDVSGVAIRVQSIAGTGASPLRVRLSEYVNGQRTDLFLGSISSANVPSQMTWISLPFSPPVRLQSGTGIRYLLSLESDSPAYQTYGLRDGADGPMHVQSTFSGGFMEFTTDGGVTWCTNKTATQCGGAGNDSVTTDMQFFFTLVSEGQ